MIKFLLRVGLSSINFVYYWIRYIKLSGISLNLNDNFILRFHALKIIHALEKSMSFMKQKYNSGFKNFYDLENIKNRNFNDKFIKDYIHITLQKFSTLKKLNNKNKKKNDFFSIQKNININFNFSNFFLSRKSCRNFLKKKVSLSIINKTVNYAKNSPSVCNRQTWNLYICQNKKIIDKILKLQNGNQGFSETIYNLGIVTVDLKAFTSGNEIYQAWIEGGIFSSTLVYSFHSMGVATCCLNWSQSAFNDIRLRNLININSSENVIMFIAFGYSGDFRICDSKKNSNKNFIEKIVLK